MDDLILNARTNTILLLKNSHEKNAKKTAKNIFGPMPASAQRFWETRARWWRDGSMKLTRPDNISKYTLRIHAGNTQISVVLFTLFFTFSILHEKWQLHFAKNSEE